MATPAVGTDFAGYHIERLLGRGGAGLVYLAQDLRLSRYVALKILAADLADDERFRERFVRESRLAASIDHHNIVPIYQAGEDDGVLYIAMRYVVGTDLRRLLLDTGPLEADRALDIIAQVASALDGAHAQGLVHRDVKPANILVVPRSPADGRDHAYLTDFGITKRMTTDVSLTATGQFVGTVDYVAPEQIMGGQLDGRADIYSLGCVLYECLAGTPPFQRDSDVATMYAHLSDARPLLSSRRSDLPAAIDEVVATAMARSPEERYGSGAALVAAASGALRGDDGRGITAAGQSRPTVTAEPPIRDTVVAGAAPTAVTASPTAEAVTPPTVAAMTPPTVAAMTPPTVAAVTPPTVAVMTPPALPTGATPPAWPASAPAGRPVRAGPGKLLAAVVVALILLGAGAAVALLRSRGSSTQIELPPVAFPSGGSPFRSPSAVLTVDDFAPGTVTAISTPLRLADVRCGAAPPAGVDERNVAFQGTGASSGTGYYEAVATFATAADAHTYMDKVAAATNACVGRLSTQRPAPQLGDQSVRLLFPSNQSAQFTYDAVYVSKGRMVSLVLISMAGTTPPPEGDAVTYAQTAVQHMTAAGA